MKKICALFVLLVVCVFTFLPATTEGVARKDHPKLRKKDRDAIAGSYIVVLEDWAAGPTGDYSMAGEAAEVLASAFGGKLKHVYKHALNGFSVEMSEEQALAMADDVRVACVEEDGVMTADATQTGATWGLDRIDQRDRPLNGTYVYNWTGSGVRAYIIDTGILTGHTQFRSEERRVGKECRSRWSPYH